MPIVRHFLMRHFGQHLRENSSIRQLPSLWHFNFYNRRQFSFDTWGRGGTDINSIGIPVKEYAARIAREAVEVEAFEWGN